MSETKLDLGAGSVRIEGYTPIDRLCGKEVYPLDYPDGSVGEVRASHILEHFSHRQTQQVLADWVRVLKPGGLLKVAVPNFDKIVEYYNEGTDQRIEAFMFGAHSDTNDYHGAMFNEQKLRELLSIAGLVDIGPWVSEVEDCASMPVSLNLQGRKPATDKRADKPEFSVAACMSMPRLAFTDNYFCAFQALMPHKIPLRKHTGAFWGMCLTRCIEETIEAQPDVDAILTIDYDTIFTRDDVAELVRLMRAHPEADAIASLQASRSGAFPLMTINGDDGKPMSQVTRDMFDGELTKLATAHFGLTLIRRRVFEQIEKPWFWAKPDENMAWAEGRVDDDIWFWRQMEKAGLSLYLANHVTVGHSELMIRWPDKDFFPTHQHPSNFWDHGKPEAAWR